MINHMINHMINYTINYMINNVINHMMTSATIGNLFFFFYFLVLKFGEFREPDFFPECREYRSAPRASEKLASQLGRRTRRLNGVS